MRNATLSHIVNAVQVTLACAILFGLPLSEKQVAGLVAMISAWGLVWVVTNDRKPAPPQPQRRLLFPPQDEALGDATRREH